MLLAVTLTGCNAGSAASATEGEGATVTETAKEEKTENASPAAAATDSSGEASGDVTIWYYWETPGHQEALDHIIQEFNSQQDKVNVQAKYVPFADFKKQLSVGASAGELPDIVIPDP